MGTSNNMRKRSWGATFDGAICEGADYLVDMETSIKKNKSVMSLRNELDSIGDGVDKNYVSFLLELQGYWEAKFEEEDDEEDPTYKLFLENFKEHGDAYMLDVSLEHGVCFPILYEYDPFPVDELKRKAPKSRREDYIQVQELIDNPKSRIARSTGSSPIQEDKVTDIGGDIKTGQKISSSEKERAKSINHNTPDEIKSRIPRSHQVTCGLESSVVLADETYNNFLTNLIVTGESVYYECGDHKRIFYEGSDEQVSIGSVIKPLVTAPRPSSLTPKLPTLASNVPATTPRALTRPATPSFTTSILSKHFPAAPITISRSPTTALATPRLPSTAPIATLTLPAPPSKAPVNDGRPPTWPSAALVTTLRPSDHRSPAPITTSKSTRTPAPLTRPPIQTPAPATRPPIQTSAPATRPLTTQVTTPRPSNHRPPALLTTPRSQSRAPSPPTHTSMAQVTTPRPSNHPSPLPITTPRSQTLPPTRPNTTLAIKTPPSKTPGTYLKPSTHTSTVPMTTPRPPIPPSRALVTSQKSPNWKNYQTMLNKSDKTFNSNLRDSGGIFPWFWDKLFKFLKKPYDQKEYDDLWMEITTRRPVLIHRESRSGGSDRPGQVCLSYLDKYPDFDEEIQKVKSDPCKVLNLLRMFSFYLQKLAHGRIPKPWLDDYSKTILPGSN